MSESNNLTYYKRNRDMVLSKIKKSMQKVNIGTYQKNLRIKKENMERIDIIICLKKRSKI